MAVTCVVDLASQKSGHPTHTKAEQVPTSSVKDPVEAGRGICSTARHISLWQCDVSEEVG